MKNTFRIGVLAALAAMTLGISQANAAGITWTQSLSSAMSMAKKSGKPIFVDFSATWCAPCKEMEKTTFKNAKVIAESKKWVMVHIDIDKQEAVAKKYKITAMPTQLIMKPSGTTVSRVMRGQDASGFLKWMKSKYAAAKK